MLRMVLVLASAVLVAATGSVLAQSASPSDVQPPRKAAPAPAVEEMIEGPARALAGHILMIADQPIRLFGMHAPRMNDPRGALSRAALDDLIAGASVACAVVGTDRRQHPVARCRAGGRDLAEAMIRDGWAYSRRRRTAEYDAAEAEARGAGRGFWEAEGDGPASERFWGAFLVLLGGFLAAGGGWLAQRSIRSLEREDERRGVASALLGELRVIAALLTKDANLSDLTETAPLGKTRQRIEEVLPRIKHERTVFKNSAARVGVLLASLPEQIVGFYGQVLADVQRMEELVKKPDFFQLKGDKLTIHPGFGGQYNELRQSLATEADVLIQELQELAKIVKD